MRSVNDMTTAPIQAAAPVRTGSWAGRTFRQLGIDTQYVLLGFPLGIITVFVCMVGSWLAASPRSSEPGPHPCWGESCHTPATNAANRTTGSSGGCSGR